ncbi:hypothetical protein GQ600_10401 [Phytophthora cactorum]|nr:hypothetical protein GQ600_10401 [Phytophthora cactorum]
MNGCKKQCAHVLLVVKWITTELVILVLSNPVEKAIRTRSITAMRGARLVATTATNTLVTWV